MGAGGSVAQAHVNPLVVDINETQDINKLRKLALNLVQHIPVKTGGCFYFRTSQKAKRPNCWDHPAMGVLGPLLGAKELVAMSMDGVTNSHRELIRSIMAGEMHTEYFQKKWPGF